MSSGRSGGGRGMRRATSRRRNADAEARSSGGASSRQSRRFKHLVADANTVEAEEEPKEAPPDWRRRDCWVREAEDNPLINDR
ncbi:MAG: hypothetical protein M1827_002078 [Pycnora praestabilis]|nr:MAG: hypothetical protein M1827_002078 [Pycnora praestabilis]